jgi:haloacetate dehalogenase
MFENFTRKKIDVAGIHINCAIGGSGPPLLLLHGLPQTMAMWAAVAPVLAREFTVVCADLRGYGDSSRPLPLPDVSNYSFRDMAQDQLAVMKSFGHARFHVVGHDRGGRVAYRLALDHPDIIRSLAVLDIVPTTAMYDSMDFKRGLDIWVWLFQATSQPLPERLIAANPDLYFEHLIGAAYDGGAKFKPEQLAEYRRCWNMPEMARSTCADYRAGATIDYNRDQADLAAGRKIACPTLAMWGTRGVPAGYFDGTAEWKKFCSDLQTATVEGGHFFVDERPEETAQKLRDFLMRCEGR